MNNLSRPLRITLIVSLLLNVLLFTGLATVWLQRPSERGPRSTSLSIPHPRELARNLPEDRRPLLREVLQQHRGKLRESVRELRASRREVAAAMVAEPFDAARVEAAFAVLREHDARTAARAQHMLIDFAGRLDAHERQRIAELLVQPPRRRGDARRGDNEARQQGDGGERDARRPDTDQ